MSLHSAIMKLTPDIDEVANDIICTLTYNGHKYVGFAFCHTEDSEFYSPIVGSTIAHYRAMIKIYDDEIARAETAAQVLWNGYKDVIYNSQTAGAPADPTGAFAKRCAAANYLVEKYKVQRDSLRQNLREYIANHEKAISSVRKMRESSDKND